MKNITIIRKNIYYLFFSIVLIFVAGLRIFGWANDTSNYYEMAILRNETKLFNKEYFLKLIIILNNKIFPGNFITFLLIFAVIGVSIKLCALIKLSPLPLLSIMMYLLSYFWLHEYIQIRAGIATGIFLFATKDMADRNFMRFFLKALLATMFHWSSIVIIPIYFLIKCKSIFLYAVLPILGIVLYIANINISHIIEIVLNITNINQVFYKMYAGYQNKINVFNLINISYLLIFYGITLIIIFSHNIVFDKYEIALYKVFSVGIFIFFLTSLLDAPVVAFRLLEYLMVVLLVLIPYIINKFKEKLFFSIIILIYYSIYSIYLFKNVIKFE
jgi:hypothetical protein